MRQTTLALTLLVALGLTWGLARTDAQAPAAINPVGSYQISTLDENGTPLSGTLVVRAANGNYAGEFVAPAGDSVPILRVTTSATHLMMVLETGSGPAMAWLEKQADGTFTGTWHLLMPGIGVKAIRK
jgi:hypothetical protein